MFSIANFLFAYMFIVLLGLLFLFFNLYHLSRYGLNDRKTYILMFIYTFTFLTVVISSALWLSFYDWSATIDFTGANNNSLTNF